MLRDREADAINDHCADARHVEGTPIKVCRHRGRSRELATVPRPDFVARPPLGGTPHVHGNRVLGFDDPRSFQRGDRSFDGRGDPGGVAPGGIFRPLFNTDDRDAVGGRHLRVVADRDGVVAGLELDLLAGLADHLAVHDDVRRNLRSEDRRRHAEEADFRG